MPFILGIITARGGSKGIPDKNIKICGGQPMIAWTIQAALQSKYLNDTILSTDSQKIADIAEDYKLQVGQLRPASLATDTATSLDVIRHEIEQYEAATKQQVDIVVILQPTSPLRLSEDIDLAIEEFLELDSNSMVSACENHHVHPSKIYRVTENEISPLSGSYNTVRRQKMERILTRNGALFICKRHLPMEMNCLIDETVGLYEMPKNRSVDIDDYYDLKIADFLLHERTTNG